MKKIPVLAACLMLLAAGAAQAALIITDDFSADITRYSSGISMRYDGDDYELSGGPMTTSTLGATALAYLYCLNPTETIYNRSYSHTAISTDGVIYGSLLANANKIAYLLTEYGATATGDRARALQAAIWTLVNPDWTLDRDESTRAERKYYSQYLQSVTGYTATDLVGNFYWITPGMSEKDIAGMAYQAVIAPNPSPAPVPGTLMLLGSGLAGLAGIARFRRNRIASR
jgi:hypothetical protein